MGSGSHAQAQLDDFGVGGALHVLCGCARAYTLNVAPELVSELEAHLRAFICSCSCCSLGMFRRGSYGRHRECGRSHGRGHLGRRDGCDRSIMTAHRLCKSVFRGNRGVVRVAGHFTGVHARVGEILADTTGSASKLRGRACPL
jgi:hypothetical protein